MTHFLREAFALACEAAHKIQDTYDYAGFMLWRAVMDEEFLAVDPAAIKSPKLRVAAQLYDYGHDYLQGRLYSDMMKKCVRGAMGPKPDTKDVLFRGAGLAAGAMTRVNWTSPAGMLAAGFGIAVLGMAFQNGMHPLQDALAALSTAGGHARISPRQP